MVAAIDSWLGRLAARWVARVTAAPARTIALCLALALGITAYALPHLELDSNEGSLFADDLEFVQKRADLETAFPHTADPIVVVVEGETSDHARRAANRLAEHLLALPERFARVVRPGSGHFFEKHGLLYLDLDDLEQLADRLILAQPLLGELARDRGLHGFFSLLADSIDATSSELIDPERLVAVLDEVSASVEAELAGRQRAISWMGLIYGDFGIEQRREFLLVSPVVDFSQVRPAGAAIEGLRELFAELGLDGSPPLGARARMTGTFVLSYEESQHVDEQSRLAGLVSFVLVSIVMVGGLGSWRMAVCAMTTLLIGLGLTAGFAALAVGRLNLISVAFAVLFIGLSIDFGIHLCVRYRELAATGASTREALRGAARSVGGSLAICALTTAIGFYSFVPTRYLGVAELGLIAGTGMFVSLVANLTLLPALLARFAPASRVSSTRSRMPRGLSRWLDVPRRHARGVLFATLVATVVAIAWLPEVEFDANPLRMRDPTTESVQTFEDLLEQGQAFPWNVSILADDRPEAAALARRLEALPRVAEALTLDDFVPDAQAEKLEILEELELLLGPALSPAGETPASTPQQTESALLRLESELEDPAFVAVQPGLAAAARRLRVSLERFRTSMLGREGDRALGRLEYSLLGTLSERLRILGVALGAGPVSFEDLPDEVVERFRDDRGRVRIEVFPSDNLDSNEALERYVAEVKSVAPDVVGEGVVILESERAVIDALTQALATAALAIFALLLLVWRNLRDALLVAVPIGLSALFTAAAAAGFGMPINFANVIVIPLLLGMGVDSGIHLVHRLRMDGAGTSLLETSTARAVLLSALTTIASFGTLGLSSHPGIASLGRLLALGLTFMLLTTMGVLPALARLAIGEGPPSRGPSRAP